MIVLHLSQFCVFRLQFLTPIIFLLGSRVSVPLHTLEASQQFTFLRGRVFNDTPKPKTAGLVYLF
jgi:hypothetical protein